MQVTQFDKSPHILLLIKSPFLRGVRPGTPGVCGFLSNDVGQTANEKRGAQDEALSENEEGGGEGGAQSASGGRPAKRPRTEEQSPLATESELVPPSSELRPRSAVPTPTLTSTSPLVSQPSPLQSATAQPAPIHTHLTGFTAAPADRPPPQASQSSFTGPHSIGKCNANECGSAHSTSTASPAEPKQPFHLSPFTSTPTRGTDFALSHWFAGVKTA